jgi:hypothetical protein
MATSIKEKSRSFRKCLGINNRSNSEDLILPDYKNEYSYELEVGENININNAYTPSMRGGVSLLKTVPTYSMWATQDENKAFCVQNDCLCKLFPDLTTYALASGFPNSSKVSYVEINDTVYLTNYLNIGYIRDDTYEDIPAITQTFKIKMPAGQCIEYYWGRLYVARDNVLWFSDALRFNRLDLRKNFKVLPDEIDLVAAADDGLYVAAGGITYFLEGTNPHKFVLRPVAPYGAYRGQKIVVPGEKILNGQITKPLSVWSSTEGICIGMPSGQLRNITISNYIMPDGNTFACFFREDKTKKDSYGQIITTVR